MKTPLCAPPPGAVQVPFKAGEQVSTSTRANAWSLLQTVIAALQPALGGSLTSTVTWAEAFPQGVMPFTV